MRRCPPGSDLFVPLGAERLVWRRTIAATATSSKQHLTRRRSSWTNAEGLSLEPSTNAAGYPGVKIMRRSETLPFQASPRPLAPHAPHRSAPSLRLHPPSAPSRDPLGSRVPGQPEARRQEHQTGQLRHGRGGRPVLRGDARRESPGRPRAKVASVRPVDGCGDDGGRRAACCGCRGAWSK